MTLRVLWPRRDPKKDNSAELEGLGENLEAIFGGGMDNVTEEQWTTCDGIVGNATITRNHGEDTELQDLC